MWQVQSVGRKNPKWCAKCRSKTHNKNECKATKKNTVKKVKEKTSKDKHSFASAIQEDKDRRRSQENTNLLVDTGATSHIIDSLKA